MTAAHLAADARERLAGVWRQPVYRSGYLLVANAVTAAMLGVAFWLVAARLYSPSVVGTNAAAISAMLFLAGVAQLNLMSAVVRFVPAVPAHARRLITTAFAVAAGVSGAAAVVFLYGIGHWAPGLSGLFAPPGAKVAFVVATMASATSVMQDSALVAVSRPGAVVVENLAFGAAKLVAIVAAVVVLPATGIWYSWTASTLLAIAGTCTFLFARAVPAFAATRVGEPRAPSLRDLGRFIGPDYVGALAWIACTALVPVLVFDLTDPRAAAAFALAWSICLALYGVPAAFGQSLVAHGAHDRASLDERHRRVLAHALGVLVPVVLVLELATPLVLAPFGPWYADHCAPVLRLLAASTLPNAVVALAVSRARITMQMRVVVTILVALAALVLGLTLLLVPSIGVIGAGIAWLTGQVVVAGAVLVGSRARGVSRRVRARPVITLPPGWTAQRRFSTVSDTAAAFVRSGARRGVLKVALTERGRADVQRERDLLHRLGADDRLGEFRTLLPAVLEASPDHIITSRLPGRTMRARADAAGVLSTLHGLDRTIARLDDELLDGLVSRPAGVVAQALVRPRERAALDQLVWCVRYELAGHEVALGWSHGDFWPGNVLVARDGTVRGVLDWAQARERDLSALDLVHWVLTTSGHGSFGARVARRLANGCWAPEEYRLVNAGQVEPIPARALLLLGWLRHVSDNLAKSDRYRHSPLWRRRNVTPVLRAATR